MASTPLTSTLAPASDDTCNIKKDGSGVVADPFGMSIGNVFAGIPQNIIINMFIFSMLFFVFILLRKRRWGSANIPLVGGWKNEWSSVFYGNRALDTKLDLSPSSSRSATTPGSEKLSPDSPRDGINGDGYDVGIIKAGKSQEVVDAYTFREWVRNAVLARDEFLLERSGPAALEYLRFQRHVIVFTAVLCLISITIILPINHKGIQQSDLNQSFPLTTISNIDSMDDTLWVHVVCTLILFPMALLVMYSYGMKFGLIKVVPKKTPKTLMIYGLKTRITTEDLIRQHFQEVYRDIEIMAINLTLNVTKLDALDAELAEVNKALAYYDQTMQDSSERPIVRNVICGYCLGKCVHGVDAMDFYQDQKANLEKKIEEEVASWKMTNPVFFITFGTVEMADRVHKDYHLKVTKKPRSSVSDSIGAKHWTARFAPSASFVSWQNLSSDGLMWWAKAIVINALLLLVLIFLTTPAMILNMTTKTVFSADSAFVKSIPFLSQFLPTIILLTVAGLMPVFIYYSVAWTGYHTKSKQVRAEMKLLYAFLLLAILILPSLALTSLDILYDIFTGVKKFSDIKFSCAFLPDNGAIYVNLMVTTAFVGAATRLLRLGQLFVFLCRFFCCARSDAERYILTRTKQEFPYHQYYPDFLLTFAIISVYCFICPVITPFGLITLIMKYLIDRYNLSYVYGRTSAPNSVHATGVNFFLVSIIMQNWLMLFFFLVRSGSKAMSGLLIASLVVNLLIYVLISWFGLLRKVSLYEEYNEDDFDTPAASVEGTPVKKARSGIYVPPVLQRYEAGRVASPTAPLYLGASSSRDFNYNTSTA